MSRCQQRFPILIRATPYVSDGFMYLLLPVKSLMLNSEESWATGYFPQSCSSDAWRGSYTLPILGIPTLDGDWVLVHHSRLPAWPRSTTAPAMTPTLGPTRSCLWIVTALLFGVLPD